ncbi:phosphodiesterase [Sphingobium boeckii]|uniref:3',5'-cyclic AMP phosphodiesterase CpdA n=1 Tax=Sphingobium boeckii TaxID=1082345 RepID=A0A7W9AHV3_9SPHN|nr:phosphodiesterase [Sphingobium boeckii]MBB5685858.1 3',5'-cyclic AMP phosphodiesterase CpdA [Sphingobium boeckii]
MLIGQITDIHLGFDPDNPAEFNRKRLDQVLRYLGEPHNKPDMLLATGDLVDRGDGDSYRRLRNALSMCDYPVWPCLGNHDIRENFIAHFPEIPVVDGFIQYEVDTGPLRLLFLDTLEEGRHGGSFCDIRASWLRDRLVEKPGKPVIIVMHHPPVEVGIEWMNTAPDEPWVLLFAATIAGHGQIKSLICGHLHRPIVAAWNGTTVAICPSTAPQVALDLMPIDPDRPDGRPMIIADPPAFALHRWNGRELVTHFDNADEHVMLAKYDENMQPLVRSLLAERPG